MGTRFGRKRIVLRRVVYVDPFTEEQISQHLEILPMAGNYHLTTKRWRDPYERRITLEQWEEIWFSKVLVGEFGQVNQGILQLNLEDRAVAYPARSDGDIDLRRSIVFAKDENDILLIKMAV